MRIGFYTSNYPGVGREGGIGTYTRDLARALAARGETVHVLTAGDRATTVQDGPVTVHVARAKHFPVVERLLPGSGSCYRIGAAMKRLFRQQALDLVE